MQIESLKVFCDLVDTGSFTRSAVINGVTQSAVSQQISSLERNFKAVLVERKKGLISLTPKGKILYDNGKKVLAVYGSLTQQMDDSPAKNGSMNETAKASVNIAENPKTRQVDLMPSKPIRPSRAARFDPSPEDLQI